MKKFPLMNPATLGPGVRAAARQEPKQAESFKEFGASELYCPQCKRSMPVRERLLLVLPGGDLFEYTCASCHSSLGTRKT